VQKGQDKSKRPYITSGGLWTKWDEAHARPGATDYGKVPIANTGVDLNHAVIQNPNLRVLVQQGYYDLATPYGATDYFLDHTELPNELSNNITLKHYIAGHMMYFHPGSMRQFSLDLRDFIRN
jgi:carboxypeptidase C (cathepsin A)